MLEGTGFLIEGTAENGANRLDGAAIVKVGPAPEEPAADLEVKTYGANKREAVQWT